MVSISNSCIWLTAAAIIQYLLRRCGAKLELLIKNMGHSEFAFASTQRSIIQFESLRTSLHSYTQDVIVVMTVLKETNFRIT